MGKKGIPHRKFSKEEKMKYIRLHLDEHMPLRQIERECGIRNTLVAEWVKRYLQDGDDALEPRNGNPYAALYHSKNLSEVERLCLLVWFLPNTYVTAVACPSFNAVIFIYPLAGLLKLSSPAVFYRTAFHRFYRACVADFTLGSYTKNRDNRYSRFLRRRLFYEADLKNSQYAAGGGHVVAVPGAGGGRCVGRRSVKKHSYHQRSGVGCPEQRQRLG